MATKVFEPAATDVSDVLVEAARMQLVAIGAAIKFWARWAESAERYTRALDEQLVKLNDGSIDAVARLADASRGYLRDLADLPKEALAQFNRDLERISQPKPRSKRTRSARAKR